MSQLCDIEDQLQRAASEISRAVGTAKVAVSSVATRARSRSLASAPNIAEGVDEG